MTNIVRFVVEEAGCSSCAERVRGALEGLVDVERLELDEAADELVVVGTARADANEAAVTEALAEASAGAGHEYRIRAGS